MCFLHTDPHWQYVGCCFVILCFDFNTLLQCQVRGCSQMMACPKGRIRIWPICIFITRAEGGWVILHDGRSGDILSYIWEIVNPLNNPFHYYWLFINKVIIALSGRVRIMEFCMFFFNKESMTFQNIYRNVRTVWLWDRVFLVWADQQKGDFITRGGGGGRGVLMDK